MEYTKVNEILIHATPWMKVKHTLLKEISQTQKPSISPSLSSSIFAFSICLQPISREKWKEKDMENI